MTIPKIRQFIIGSLVMLNLMVGICGYSIYQLGRLRSAAHIALNIEQRMIQQVARLADSFLSEARYASKFIVTQAPLHYAEYKQFKSDFDRSMERLRALAASDDALQRLARTQEYHEQYHQLVDKEAEYIKTKQPYAETRYREEKDRLVDYLLREQEALKSDLQTSLQQRIGFIEEASQDSRNITLVATILLVGLGVFFLFRLTGKVPTGWRSVIALNSLARQMSLPSSLLRKAFGVMK
jgi:CHASE3 domain sensor protein